MGEIKETLPAPSQETVDWLNLGNSSRIGNYSEWRRNIVFSNEHLQIAHDAWRSTKTSVMDDPRNIEFSELQQAEKMLCTLTVPDALESIYEHIHLEPEPWRQTFGPAFIYRAMRSVYQSYYRYTRALAVMRGECSDDTGNIVRTSVNGYAKQPATYKETDRRIVVACITALSEPGTSLCSPEQQEVLLAQLSVQSAIADGKAILESGRTDIPYDQTRGHAVETTYWQL